MENKGVIYKIENLVNGKVYIGQTVRDYNRRVYEHKRKLRKNYHDNFFLQNAWNKYGEESFEFSLITECNIFEIDNSEMKWIAHYREQGLSYNLESGGKNHKTLSEITKRKISESTKSLGWVGAKHPTARKVICINTGQIFDTVVQTSQFFGVPYDNIHQVCCGNNVCAGGKDGKYYQFAYYEEGQEYILKEIKNIRKPKKVRCINTGEVFNSTREAAQKMGVGQPKISLCCNGKRSYTGKLPDGTKLKWEFC